MALSIASLSSISVVPNAPMSGYVSIVERPLAPPYRNLFVRRDELQQTTRYVFTSMALYVWPSYRSNAGEPCSVKSRAFIWPSGDHREQTNIRFETASFGIIPILPDGHLRGVAGVSCLARALLGNPILAQGRSRLTNRCFCIGELLVPLLYTSRALGGGE